MGAEKIITVANRKHILYRIFDRKIKLMADFNFTMIDPDSSKLDIYYKNGYLYISDHSNYDEGTPEYGHERADFTRSRIGVIVHPSGSTNFFPVGQVAAPSGLTEPMVSAIAAAEGDGIYRVKMMAIPTFTAPMGGDKYYSGDCVWYNVSIYGWLIFKATTTNTDANPSTSSNWILLGGYTTEADFLTFAADNTDVLHQLSAKYYEDKLCAVIAAIDSGYEKKVYDLTHNILQSNGIIDLAKNERFIDIVKLWCIRQAVGIMTDKQLYTEAEWLIALGNQIAVVW